MDLFYYFILEGETTYSYLSVKSFIGLKERPLICSSHCRKFFPTTKVIVVDNCSIKGNSFHEYFIRFHSTQVWSLKTNFSKRVILKYLITR